MSVPEWRFTWPIITAIAFASPLIYLPLLRGRSRLKAARGGLIPLLALYMWLLMSFFLFSFEAIYPRHLLLVFPALYLLSGQVLLLFQSRTLK
jgi:hypothetical protein